MADCTLRAKVFRSRVVKSKSFLDFSSNGGRPAVQSHASVARGRLHAEYEGYVAANSGSIGSCSLLRGLGRV